MFPNHDQLTWRPGVSRAGVLCGDRKCLDPQNKVTNYLHRGNYFEGSYQLTDLSQPDMILFFQLDQLLARPRTESKDYAQFCKRGLQWQVAATLGWALNPTRSPKKMQQHVLSLIATCVGDATCSGIARSCHLKTLPLAALRRCYFMLFALGAHDDED